MSKKHGMPLGEFMKRYSTERDCWEHLASYRWKNGFVCPACGHTHGWMLTNGRYQCSKCRHQTSVTAGTVMHHSHVPLTKWFLAFYFVSQDKRGISALRLSHMIGVTYKTAWGMLRRIRSAMGQRDASHLLSSVVEFDDAYFGGAELGGKRGRGTSKVKVFVALSLDQKGNPQYLKMQVTKDIRQASVKQFAQRAILKGSTILSDGYSSYAPALQDYDHQHKPYDPSDGMLHWLHVVISNAKAFILGTYHGRPKENLQPYLDEFCFRFSRRSFGDSLLDRLILAVSCSGLA